ncbi:MAG TPA: shikimate kinase [Candidatus Omnitrophota bacterium]|nr:shikimate kinase [Candidatus Omnitrophota bacterium]HQJ15001.1 shikimate kinase [Candidatus Omnitrophota bacterium]
MKNIYIVGFMGTGKTVVGRALARELKVPFIDLDSYIEETEGLTISEIFKSKGEAYFRSLEKKALEKAAEQEKNVVSCGGGVVMDPGNMASIKATGTCICLSASPQEIIKRIGVTTHRPLLQGGDPIQRVQSLLADRDAAYRKADILIDTTGLSVQDIVALILRKLFPAGRLGQ